METVVALMDSLYPAGGASRGYTFTTIHDPHEVLKKFLDSRFEKLFPVGSSRSLQWLTAASETAGVGRAASSDAPIALEPALGDRISPLYLDRAQTNVATGLEIGQMNGGEHYVLASAPCKSPEQFALRFTSGHFGPAMRDGEWVFCCFCFAIF